METEFMEPKHRFQSVFSKAQTVPAVLRSMVSKFGSAATFGCWESTEDLAAETDGSSNISRPNRFSRLESVYAGNIITLHKCVNNYGCLCP